jgi:hypothetical protein
MELMLIRVLEVLANALQVCSIMQFKTLPVQLKDNNL